MYTVHMDSTNRDLHLKVKHDTQGHCLERPASVTRACPKEGWVLTVAGPALADDPNRQWTEAEIDSGLPWLPKA